VLRMRGMKTKLLKVEQICSSHPNLLQQETNNVDGDTKHEEHLHEGTVLRLVVEPSAHNESKKAPVISRYFFAR